MAEVAALSIADAAAKLERIVAAVSDSPTKDDLAQVQELLLAATAEGDQAPVALLTTAAGLASAADAVVVETLPTRAKVVMRLLRAGATEAAWLVLLDTATGVVRREFRGSTSSGADRTDWALPLLTRVEAPSVYADLPGFRDPRYDAPDAAYEVSAAIKLRCHVDEVVLGARPRLAGWAVLDLLRTEPDESVGVVAVRDGAEVRWPGTRHRRGDLVGGSRDTLRRRAWGGWSVELAVSDLPADVGRWALSLEVAHEGFVRRARLGKSVGELAARAVGASLQARPKVSLVDPAGGWALQVSEPDRRRWRR